MEKQNKDTIIKLCLIIGGIIAYSIIGTLIINEMFFKHTEVLVYVTETGECYHAIACHYLKSVKAMGLEQAKSAGYYACSYCSVDYSEYIVINDYLSAFLVLFVITSIIAGIICYVWMKNSSLGPIKKIEYNEFQKEQLRYQSKDTQKENSISKNEPSKEEKLVEVLEESDNISKDELLVKSENSEDEFQYESFEQLVNYIGTSLRAFPIINIYNLIPTNLSIKHLQKLALRIQSFIRNSKNNVDTYSLYDINTKRFKEFQIVDEVDRFADYDEYEEDEFADYSDYLDYIKKEKENKTPQLHSSSKLAQLLINSSVGDIIEQKYIVFCIY